MSEPKDTPRTSISKARSLEEIADFWDTHSLADYWDQTHEVTFEVRAQRRRRITLDPTLISLWLQQKLAEQSSKQSRVPAPASSKSMQPTLRKTRRG